MNRGFEKVKGYEELGINLPERRTESSCGYDIESCETVSLMPKEIKLIKTGIKAFMQKDEVLKIYIRSSLPLKKGVMLANNVGIIDADYYNNETNDGHILIPLYNFSDVMVIINKGDKIAQGIFEKYLTVDNEEPVIKKRTGGFGSSDKLK